MKPGLFFAQFVAPYLMATTFNTHAGRNTFDGPKLFKRRKP
jgi:hypothetical protein